MEIDNSKQVIVTPQVQRYRDCMGKIDPVAVAELLGTPLHEGQKEIAKYMTVPLIHTWHSLQVLISRRWGKTFLGEDIVTSLMLSLGSKVLVIAHSTSLAEVWWQNILNNLMKIPKMRDKVFWDKKAGIIRIDELETEFICCSYLNVQSRAIGRAFSHIILEEHYLVPVQDQEEIRRLVFPTQANYGSKDGIKYAKVITLSTPRGTITGSPTGREFLKGLNGDKGYLSFKRTIYTSPFLTETEIQAIKDSTPADTFSQEYMVEFTKTTKTVFRHYDKEKHILSISDEDLKDMAGYSTFITSLDFGISDGNSASLVLYNPKQDTYYVFDEHYRKDEVVYDFLKNVNSKVQEWCDKFEMKIGEVIYFYDPSCKESALINQKDFNITMHKAKNNRSNGIDYVNQLLQGNGENGKPRLYFRDTCKVHHDMFEYAEFKVANGIITNQFAKDPSERQSHFDCCVTTVYATFSHFKTMHNTVIVV